ncbi:MAG: glycoside hydrolase domain-containing protein [Sedimentisphaerales bacterium]
MRIAKVIMAAALFFSGAAAKASNDWFDNFYPYRLEITLQDNAEGRIAVTLPLQDIIGHLKTVSPDIVDIDNFAFEKVILVEPTSGKVVGGFKFVIQSENLIKDSNFATLGQKDSPWAGFNPAEAKVENITADSQNFSAVMVTKTAIANTKISQPVKLDLGGFYLFQYWSYNDAATNNIGISLENPKRWFFSKLYSSYIPTLSPQGKWTHQSSLVWANVADADLRIGTAYIGSGGAGNIDLRKVECMLVVDLPAKTSTLHLYYVPRAGHKITCPNEQMVIASTNDINSVKPAAVKAEALNNNTDGVMVKGKYLTAWTIPADYPLKAGFLKSAMPSDQNTSSPLRVNLCRGGDVTVLVAIDTGTPYLNFVNYSSSLPIKARFERLAPIPVYDGPFPGSTLTETRFDAMMEPNDTLCPPTTDGIHLMAITLTAPKDAQAGTFVGKIKCTVQTPVPDAESFEIPVELHIAPVTLKPMNHFGVIFGGQFLQIPNSGPPYTKQGLSIFDFHGFAPDDKKIDWIARLTGTDQNESAPEQYKSLTSMYWNRMIDFDVQPEILPLFANYSYKITEQGQGKAPLLSDWDFSEYDTAIDEYLGKREVPWLPIWRTNGHSMHIHRLSNNVNYTFNSTDEYNKLVGVENTDTVRQVTQDEYFRLVADYFDTLAKHLDQKGYLDRAIFVIDESDTTTYKLIYKYKQVLKQRKYASRIKFAHTTYQPGVYTVKLPDGNIYMDEALDIPMPNNDEHFNFFEPSYNALFKKPKNNWVYYVETDHLNIINGGISTIITPLKLKNFGANGWWCWASFIWSMSYPVTEDDGWEFKTGPVVNPWLNPFYHHGPGMLSFFYPPDPRGPAGEPTLKVTPSYRLALIRDGIQLRALLEVLSAGVDDEGKPIKVNQAKLDIAKNKLETLWASNPVQWYISYGAYKTFSNLLFEAIEE